MKKTSGWRHPSLKAGTAMLGAAALVLGVGGIAAARSTNPLNLEVAPGEQLINLGQTATFTLSLDQSRHFTGTAQLSILSGLPKHSSAGFSSSTISGTQQVTLTVRTNSQTYTGPDNIRIKAKAPNHSDTITAKLWVVRIPLTISASPGSDSINAGQNAVYNVAIRHGRWNPNPKLSVLGLPAGATASFSPSQTTGKSSVLTIRTSATNTPAGDYTLTIVAATNLRLAQTQVVLHVAAVSVAQPFTINGSLGPALGPGSGGPIDVTLHNPNSVPITVSGVTAAVSSISGPNISAANPCTAADFTSVPMQGTVVVPAGATETLSQLGVSQANFPSLSMTNTTTSQDGCQAATLGLTWSGTATGGN
jgi:hypothetical protein